MNSDLTKFSSTVRDAVRVCDTAVEVGGGVSALSGVIAAAVKKTFVMYCESSDSVFEFGASAVRENPIMFASEPYRFGIVPTDFLLLHGTNYQNTFDILNSNESVIEEVIMVTNLEPNKFEPCDGEGSCGVRSAIMHFTRSRNWHISCVHYGGVGLAVLRRNKL